jgi:hypothetical protein
MKAKKFVWAANVVVLCTINYLSTFGQTMTLKKMVALSKPSATTIYHITDTDKQGDWQYDETDHQSPSNEGTILVSSKSKVKGRFKRIFDRTKGVNIDWFLTKNTLTIDAALRQAVAVSERVNFGPKTYEIEHIKLSTNQLLNPDRLIFSFNQTTLKARNGLTKINAITLADIPSLSLLGSLILDGNASKANIVQPLSQGGEAFLKIIAPTHYPKSKLKIGSITIINMPMCGINIDTHNNFLDKGYDRIEVAAFREINGFNHLNIQQIDFAVWCVNVRGAHRMVQIDTLYALQNNEAWGDAPIEKPYYTFTFENQVDPSVHQRKDSLYIKNMEAHFACSIILYTQAINHVWVDNYSVNRALCKPNVADAKAYPTLLKNNISWVASKHTWTSYKSPNSSFRIRKLTIKNTNPAFMNEAVANDITGLWLNKGISGAIFDEIETDVRLKFYGDGVYFGFADVPDGGHKVGTFISHIPAKKNYVQPLNADLRINKLVLGKGAGTTFSMGNCSIGTIEQEAGSKAIFESRPNRLKEKSGLYDGFMVESCLATNILWKFNWLISKDNTTNNQTPPTAERYVFRNFSGNNYLQTHTSLSLSQKPSVYMTTQRYNDNPEAQQEIHRFLQFVTFDWKNVDMTITNSSDSDLTRQYMPTKNGKGLLNAPRPNQKSKDSKNNTFENCTISY